MDCPRCHGPATEEMLQEFGGVCPKCLLAFAAEQDAPSFPNLEIVEMIGQGGMGVVYKAVQKNLNRTVALKVLSPRFSDDPEFLERFTREAQALAQLSHPNIVAIHDSGIHDRVPYLVMEYVDGRSLRALLQSREITVAQVLDLIPQICDALQYAHGRGVVHRDIKPENILVDAQGRVKIADYGLAKLAGAEDARLTKSGFTMGTPHYMAPEQVENSSEVDHRADIYSLGVIFYEMLTGELPLGRFKAPSEKGVGDRRLDPVVLKTLEKEPQDRYQSAGEVRDQITRLKKVPAPFRSRTGYVPPEPPSGLKKATFILANLGGLLVGTSLILSLMRAGLALSIGKAGMFLLFCALVLGLITMFRYGFRRARSGHPGWIAAGTMLCVLVAVLWIADQPKATPGAAASRIVTVELPNLQRTEQIWSEDVVADSSPTLELLATEHAFFVVTSSNIHEFLPESGLYRTRWHGPIEDVPWISGNWMALRSGAVLVLLESGEFRLEEKARVAYPFSGILAGGAISGGILYLQSVDGDACAIVLASGKLLWNDKALPGLSVPWFTPPIVTDLDVVTIHESGMELRDRKTGRNKAHSNTVLPSGKMIQWDQGWGNLHAKDVNVEFSTYFKSGLNFWWSMRTGTTPAVADCHLALIKDLVIFTTVNQIFSVHRNAPFQNDWGGETIPHTVGPLSPFGPDFVAVPTVEGILFFRAQDGHRMPFRIPGKGEQTFVACCQNFVSGYDPVKKKLTGYRVE